MTALTNDPGYLLTFSQIPGVDYLDRELKEHLKEPPDLLLTNDDASGVAHVAQAFIETGTDSWHRKSVEWLLVYIMTEMAVTPHNIRKGRQGLSIMGAYRVIAQDLVSCLVQMPTRPPKLTMPRNEGEMRLGRRMRPSSSSERTSGPSTS